MFLQYPYLSCFDQSVYSIQNLYSHMEIASYGAGQIVSYKRLEEGSSINQHGASFDYGTTPFPLSDVSIIICLQIHTFPWLLSAQLSQFLREQFLRLNVLCTFPKRKNRWQRDVQSFPWSSTRDLLCGQMLPRTRHVVAADCPLV